MAPSSYRKKLSHECRASLILSLNEAARMAFPGLKINFDCVARFLDRPGTMDFDFEQLPDEVRDASDFTDLPWEISLQKRLRNFLFRQNRRDGQLLQILNEFLWPALQKVCRDITGQDLRKLWEAVLETRIDLPIDLYLNFADQFGDMPSLTEPSSNHFAELILYENFIAPAPYAIRPSLSFSLSQVLELALDTESLNRESVLRRAFPLGRTELVRRALFADSNATKKQSSDTRIAEFSALTSSFEGSLLFLGDGLLSYIDALEKKERAYYAEVLGQEGIPSLDDLVDGERMADLIAADQPFDSQDRDFSRQFLERWKNSFQKYLGNDSPYQAIQNSIVSLFYIEQSEFNSLRWQPFIHQAQRWLHYSYCNNHRHGELDSSFLHDRISADRVLLRVIDIWQNRRSSRVGIEDLLRAARGILDEAQCREWNQLVTKNDHWNAIEWLLPCWLLEIRALRLFGRNSAEWNLANQLSIERLSRIVLGTSLREHWSDRPAAVLMILESLRQVVVALNDGHGQEHLQYQVLERTQEMLVRLESIDDPIARRTLSGYFQPILASIASWRAETDPAQGLCIFEMARSRWMADRLGTNSSTLCVRETDDEVTRQLKDQLYEELNGGSALAPSADLQRLIETHSRDLATAVWTNWISPVAIQSLPEKPILLAYEIEADPSEPPRLCFVETGKSWPSIRLGQDSVLWRFLIHDGHVVAERISESAWKINQKVRTLRSSVDALKSEHDIPEYQLSAAEVEVYRRQLNDLSDLVLPSLEPYFSNKVETTTVLLIPCSELFHLPWGALPVAQNGKTLIDFASIGILPSLGITLLHNAGDTPSSIAKTRSQTLIQAQPTTPSGLTLSEEHISQLRRNTTFHEGQHVTPEKVLESLRQNELVVLLCHGRTDASACLALSPDETNPCGRLTANRIDQSPRISKPCYLILGACWSGIDGQYAAEQAEGLTGLFLTKGIQAVIGASGMAPVAVELIVDVSCQIVERFKTQPISQAELANCFRNAIRFHRSKLNTAQLGLSHPWQWASLAYHGLPW